MRGAGCSLSVTCDVACQWSVVFADTWNIIYRLGIVQGASHVFIAPVIAMMALTKCPEPEEISGMHCSVHMLLHDANNDIYQCNKF